MCTQWSVKSDPDRVEGVLHKIVSQEMYHFALAGNLLSAIGGQPAIANPGFLPTYPTHTLPGGIEQTDAIDLKPLTHNQLAVFMQIEYPEFPPLALLAAAPAPATIGAFYDTIAVAFTSLKLMINPNAHAVDVPFANQVTTIADANAVIERIKSEGEGLQDSPDQPTGDHAGHAHYYLFKELYVQKRLIKVDRKWRSNGDPIRLPEVYDFKPSAAHPGPSADFNRILSRLLTDLENCCIAGQQPNVAAMFQLQSPDET